MDLTDIILATGALGTAAFGIVEALKWTPLGKAGFQPAMRLLGPLGDALRVAYGGEYQELLLGQYRGEANDLPRTLRQGVRVGLTDANADTIASFLGSLDATKLKDAIKAAEQGGNLSADQRNVIGRFELAADARIDAALSVARSRYIDTARVAASIVAIGLAIVARATMNVSTTEAIIIGVAAVPLAPIAKDVAGGIQAAAKALRARA